MKKELKAAILEENKKHGFLWELTTCFSLLYIIIGLPGIQFFLNSSSKLSEIYLLILLAGFSVSLILPPLIRLVVRRKNFSRITSGIISAIVAAGGLYAMETVVYESFGWGYALSPAFPLLMLMTFITVTPYKILRSEYGFRALLYTPLTIESKIAPSWRKIIQALFLIFLIFLATVIPAI